MLGIDTCGVAICNLAKSVFNWVFIFYTLYNAGKRMQGIGDIQKVSGGTLRKAICKVARAFLSGLVHLPVLHNLLPCSRWMWD